MASPQDVTALLACWSRGDSTALDRLLPLVYDECRRIASRQLRHEHREHTLDPTGLVHEAYLKLVDSAQLNWKDRGHFFAVAAKAMRQIIIDYARWATRKKRGGGVQKLSGPVLFATQETV